MIWSELCNYPNFSLEAGKHWLPPERSCTAHWRKAWLEWFCALCFFFWQTKSFCTLNIYNCRGCVCVCSRERWVKIFGIVPDIGWWYALSEGSLKFVACFFKHLFHIFCSCRSVNRSACDIATGYRNILTCQDCKEMLGKKQMFLCLKIQLRFTAKRRPAFEHSIQIGVKMTIFNQSAPVQAHLQHFPWIQCEDIQ